MATNANEFYDAVRHLPPMERIRLAALILDDLSNDSSVFSDFWTEEDINNLTVSPSLTVPMNKTTKLPESGDVVVVDFPGVIGTKRRPAVVVSSSLYHK